jgi:transcriptional regulator with XRE-family HTH domain
MINENIRQVRRNASLTQEQLASKLGVTRQTISKWENGTSVPDADVVSKMASILDVHLNEILGCDVREVENNDVAKILAALNEELAEKNRFRKMVVKIIKIVLILIGAGFTILLAYAFFWMWIAA